MEIQGFCQKDNCHVAVSRGCLYPMDYCPTGQGMLDPLDSLPQRVNTPYAQGLYSFYEVLKDDHELFVVAPDSERSAVGHAITLVDSLRVRSVNRNGSFFGLALSGTSADCVKFAVHYSYPFRSHILFDLKFFPYTTNLVCFIS